MADLTAGALRLAIRQHGAVTTTQLAATGVSRNTVRRMVAAGHLVHSAKSVYRLPTDERTLEQRCAELCLAHRSVFVTGPTAGVLIGLRRMPSRTPITLSSPHPLHLDLRGIRIRRTTSLGPTDTIVRHDGITIASPTRLAFDLSADLGDQAHRSVLDQLRHQHGVTPTQLRTIAHRLCHPARPGSARFMCSLVDLTDGASESDAERRVAEALLDRRVPVELNQQWLDLPGGSRARSSTWRCPWSDGESRSTSTPATLA